MDEHDKIIIYGKNCARCGVLLTSENSKLYMILDSRYICNDCRRRYEREWVAKNKDKKRLTEERYKRNFIQRFGNDAWNKRIAERAKKRYRINRQHFKTYQSNRRKQFRFDCLVHYSSNPPKCVCCGESELDFLTIDHVKNDGSTHRKQIGGSSNFYCWLKKNDFPEGYQVLCFNCNLGKSRNSGMCPHKRGR